jgi:TP901 family phage tail tape measure protein
METGATAVVGRGLVEILPDFKKWGAQLASDMRAARTQLDGSAAGLRRSAATVGKSMAMVGKGTTALGLGVAAVSVKMAADFQSHTAVLQTAAGETSKGLEVVRSGIKNIAMGTGTGIQNLTDGMYTIEKAGFRGSQGLQVLRAAAQGAREENAKLSDVTNAMTSIMASYHLKATDSVRVMNAMKTAAGEGKITMEEFSGALSTVLPIASANHIAFEDIAGSMATLTQHGTSAREATHELSATIRALASPNMVASREMARFGLSATDVSKNLGKRGLSGTVNLLVNTIFKEMGPAGIHLQKIFEGTKQSGQDAQIMLKNMTGDQKRLAQAYLKGNMLQEDWNSNIKGMPVSAAPALRNFKVLVDRSRGFSRELKNGSPASQVFTDALKKMAGGAIGLNTVLQITGESAQGNAERIKKVGESFHHNSKDVEGWKITSGLLNVQLDRMKAQFQVLAIDIGTKLIPAVSAVVGFFAKHRDILLAVAAAIGVFIAATSAAYIATKLWWLWTKTLAVAQGIVTAATFAWTVATMAQTDSMVAMRAQLVLLAVQEKVVALWTAITESAFWGLAAAILANPITWIVVAIVALVAGIYLLATRTKFFQTVWKATWGFVKTVFLGFYHWFKDNWQLITFTIMTLGIGLAVAEIVRHWKGVKKAFSATIDWVKHNWPLLLEIITGPIGWAVLLITRYWDQISGGAETAYHATIDWFKAMGKDIGHFFTSTLPDFFKALPGRIVDIFNTVNEKIAAWTITAGKVILDFITKLPGRIMHAQNAFGEALISAGGDLISGLWKGASDFFTKSVPGFFKMLWHGIVDYFKAVFGIHSPSTVMADLGVNLIMGLLNGMLTIAKTIGGWFKTHIYQPVIDFFANAGNWLYNYGRSLLTGMVRGLLVIATTLHTWMSTHIYKPVTSFFSNAGQWLYNYGRNTITGLVRGLGVIASGISSWLSSHVKSPLVNFFRGAGDWLAGHGRSVIAGLLSGFQQKWKDAIGWVKGIKKKVVDAITKAFGISSPARSMIPLGMHIIGGLMKGMLSSGPVLRSAVKSIFHNVTDLMKRGGSLLGGLLGDLGGSIGLGDASVRGSAQQYAQLYMKTLGFGPSQWPALKALWNGESGWNPLAHNAASGAHGIPQSLPASKMRSEGADYMTNAATQIRWGLKYIKSRYGSPASAYSKWLARSPHWYDAGGIAKGIGAMMKNTNKPERVLSPRQTVAFENLVGAISGPQRSAPSAGLTIDKLIIENHGVIASRQEAEDWLVAALVTLKRKNRLP